eukprot:4015496-Pleurochrysis_carterae.AAC.1
MAQKERLAVFRAFRQVSSGVLVCTDVAARGLNLEGIHWIVQYDLPQANAAHRHGTRRRRARTRTRCCVVAHAWRRSQGGFTCTLTRAQPCHVSTKSRLAHSTEQADKHARTCTRCVQ